MAIPDVPLSLLWSERGERGRCRGNFRDVTLRGLVNQLRGDCRAHISQALSEPVSGVDPGVLVQS